MDAVCPALGGPVSLIFTIPEAELDHTDWFSRSYEAILGLDRLPTWRQQDRAYEQFYGVKLHYGETAMRGDMKPVIAVEFPSEAAATLFFLRWS